MYDIEYTKKVKLETLKVGDVIEPAWLWELRLKVAEVARDGVRFENGVVRTFADWYDQKVEVVKVRKSATPEWFGK
jgi:hypothetical protein